ncbi:MAG: universal stress protein [Actinobacteria bacterium]|nr:universal stress protein [Actinomycetota bacterium]
MAEEPARMPSSRAMRPVTESTGGAGEAAPPPLEAPSRILLASTGAPFDRALIERVVELAGGGKPRVHVLSIAKIWGTSLGLPHPGLQPSKREVEEQKRIVADAARQLKRLGLEVRTRVIATRKAARTIAEYAEFRRCRSIVIAEPAMPRWRRIVEGSRAREVASKTSIPVQGVPTAPEPRRGRKAG